ncbi:hypothetical protein T01_12649 [Trichinella spiralis]|uniref:Uncharacterized protein n=1 Tax=Trichinella spiralis TaxID=6334 RepID=A0A0V1BK72_TRISP|nr:hypothetical protein T01_12649 [Trichinella spiralis]
MNLSDKTSVQISDLFSNRQSGQLIIYYKTRALGQLFFARLGPAGFVLLSSLQKLELNNCTRMWKFHKCIVAKFDEIGCFYVSDKAYFKKSLKNKGGVCIVINSLRSELRSSKAICSLDRWSSKAISRRQGSATDKKSTMPIPLLTTTDRLVVNNSGRLLTG